MQMKIINIIYFGLNTSLEPRHTVLSSLARSVIKKYLPTYKMTNSLQFSKKKKKLFVAHETHVWMSELEDILSAIRIFKHLQIVVGRYA